MFKTQKFTLSGGSFGVGVSKICPLGMIEGVIDGLEETQVNESTGNIAGRCGDWYYDLEGARSGEIRKLP